MKFTKEIQRAAKVFYGLSHEKRLAVYLLILEEGKNGMSPGDILNSISIPPQTLSFHLKELKESHLIISRRNGVSLLYSPDQTTLKKLKEFFTLLNSSSSSLRSLRKHIKKEIIYE